MKGLNENESEMKECLNERVAKKRPITCREIALICNLMLFDWSFQASYKKQMWFACKVTLCFNKDIFTMHLIHQMLTLTSLLSYCEWAASQYMLWSLGVIYKGTGTPMAVLYKKNHITLVIYQEYIA